VGATATSEPAITTFACCYCYLSGSLLGLRPEGDVAGAGMINLDGDLAVDVGEEAALIEREELWHDEKSSGQFFGSIMMSH
jgi:hypothetical protein